MKGPLKTNIWKARTHCSKMEREGQAQIQPRAESKTCLEPKDPLLNPSTGDSVGVRIQIGCWGPESGTFSPGG